MTRSLGGITTTQAFTHDANGWLTGSVSGTAPTTIIYDGSGNITAIGTGSTPVTTPSVV